MSGRIQKAKKIKNKDEKVTILKNSQVKNYHKAASTQYMLTL